MTEELISMEEAVWEELRNKEKRLKILAELEQKGAIIFDPEHTYINSSVKIGKGTVIHPYVLIYSNTVIGEKCIIWASNVIIESNIGNSVVIESFCKIEEADIGDFVTIRSHSKVAAGSTIGNWCKIGPQACLRPGALIEDGIDIGKADI